MESTGNAAEADPLKRGEEGGEPGSGPGRSSATELRKKGCKEVIGFAKLTHWRTAVFFFSLFLCLTIVFAFSFIIPCPVRPQYLASWNRTYNSSASYDFLSIQDASKDKVMDVLFALRDTEGTLNNTCADAGLSSPCVFMLALDGTDGETLWERPLQREFHWAQCGLEMDSGRNWDCLLSHSNDLSALDKSSGEVRWQQPRPSGLQSTLPVLSLPDLNGDSVGDVALVASDNTQTQVLFLSGKTGEQLGSTVVLDAMKTASHLSHHTAKGSQYVLLQRDSGLYGLALWRIAAQAGAKLEGGFSKDKYWEAKADATTGLITIYKSDSLREVLKTGPTDDVPNLLLVTEKNVVLLDGKNLQVSWSVNTSSLLSEPSFGHYNKDSVLDVVIEEDAGNNSKRVVILDGVSGGVLWEVPLLATPNSPRPASIHTTNGYSIFVFWGLKTENTSLLTSDRRIYMLHPVYSKVLLEATSSAEHIVKFKATLLERGRHAAYILLTGPGAEGADGTVFLSKWKLKQDVPHSKVLPIGKGESPETTEDIKEAFNRLRFSDL